MTTCTTSTRKKMRQKLATLLGSAMDNDNNKNKSNKPTRSMMTRIPGLHRRTPSLATVTTATASTSEDAEYVEDADVTYTSHNSGGSASCGIDGYLEGPRLDGDDADADARSLGSLATFGTTGDVTAATDATPQVGNLSGVDGGGGSGKGNGFGPSILSTILDVSAVDISLADCDDDGDGAAAASCDDDFDLDDDPILIAGSAVTIDYIFQPGETALTHPPNATGGRDRAATCTSTGARHGTKKGRGSDAGPIISSSFAPKVVGDPTGTTPGSGSGRGERQQRQQRENSMCVLESFLDRFSCGGGGCDLYSNSACSIHEM